MVKFSTSINLLNIWEKRVKVSKVKWIRRFEPVNPEKLLDAALETAAWIEQNGHTEGHTEWWEPWPEHEVGEDELLMKDTSLYGGAAGVALLYLRLYKATGEKQWLEKAKAGVEYCIAKYRGKDEFHTEQPYLQGAYVGFFNGAAGGGYVAHLLGQLTGEERYQTFAKQVADDTIDAAKVEDGALSWYGFYGILGEGAVTLFLLEMYEAYGDERYLKAADQSAEYIDRQKEKSPWGGYRWNVLPTETFPTIGKPGGYFPGFEYGAAGCGYILAKVWKHTGKETYLETAKGAAEYILNIADYSEDGVEALVRYNDTYLTDLYYLGVCQGPIGTSRLFYVLYQLTGEERYEKFVIQLTNGLASGAPVIHSEGYWRTNCYCCGGAGMLEHFLHMHRFTGDDRYLQAAYDAAEAIIGESTYDKKIRKWYTSWNRHEPDRSDAYIGLYHGSGGCASALLAFRQYLEGGEVLPPYLEDPYKDLYK